MDAAETSYITVDQQRSRSATTAPVVVWLGGDHDVATADAIAHSIAEAAADPVAPVVVDLSKVTFMDAATIRVLARADDDLRRRKQSLSLRCPSTVSRRLLDVCGLAHLLASDGGSDTATAQ